MPRRAAPRLRLRVASRRLAPAARPDDRREPLGDSVLRRALRPRRADGAGRPLPRERSQLPSRCRPAILARPDGMFEPRSAMTLVRRGSTGSSDHDLEPGLVVLEPQFAAMQMRHRGGEAQAQPRARLRTALLQPHEALDHPLAVGFGDAGPAVGDASAGWCRRRCRPRPRSRLAARPLQRRVIDGPAYLIALSTRLASA